MRIGFWVRADYLVHRSPGVEGTILVVGVTSARTELEPGAPGIPFDILDTSPEYELMRIMAETWPGQTVFLPLDDPMFTDRTVAVSYEQTTYVAALKEHYDAVLQDGLARRWPSG